ncbi:uncharacterized protein DFL_000417 [Arthrobotrys flagrans]|uniref:Uncharacterized protein n=1 Tax=Arthrobotrys flagrans TaxID=97331 RepID=A0A437AF27_ARTFL|nr:hypothetical protein DFL_000417 [Arthrobotrys flagrans]
MKRYRRADQSDSSLPSAPSDDENPFRDDFPPKNPGSAPESTPESTPSRRAKLVALQERFQDLTILGLNSPITGDNNKVSYFDTPLEFPNNPFALLPPPFSPRRTSVKRSIQRLMFSENVDQGGADGSASEPVLKSAIKRTDYVYVRPGGATRSVNATRTKHQRLREQLKSITDGPRPQKSENLSPRPPGPDGIPAAKRVRFATGSKETSYHVVLEPPDDTRKKAEKPLKK